MNRKARAPVSLKYVKQLLNNYCNYRNVSTIIGLRLLLYHRYCSTSGGTRPTNVRVSPIRVPLTFRWQHERDNSFTRRVINGNLFDPVSRGSETGFLRQRLVPFIDQSNDRCLVSSSRQRLARAARAARDRRTVKSFEKILSTIRWKLFPRAPMRQI